MKKWIGQVAGSSIEPLFDTNSDKANEPVDVATAPTSDTQTRSFGDGDIVSVADQSELLAATGSAMAAVYELLAQKQLNPYHTSACHLEAEALIREPDIDASDLTDMTGLPFVTIDNEDSRDLDQALYIEQQQQNGDNQDGLVDKAQWVVYYALADAAHYVRPGMALFDEALLRGVTYYVPGLSVPMLPRSLSEQLISLNPGVDRRALVFMISIDADGEVINTTLRRARINSRAKLSYHGVQAFYDSKASHSADLAKGSSQNSTVPKTTAGQHEYDKADFAGSLLLLMEVGERRIKQAEKRNVVDYERVEAGITINDKGRFDISLRQRVDTERYNEQLSLLCNMEGARLLMEYGKLQTEHDQSIFRIHSPPLQQRLAELQSKISQIVELRKLPPQWIWQQNMALSDYVQQLPDHQQYSALRRCIERMILLTNRASLFSTEPGPHHALGVTAYARFSSPMREIVGIFTHKELLESLGLAEKSDLDIDSKLQEAIVARANLAKKVQKKLDQEFLLMAITEFLRDDLEISLANRPRRQGTVMGVRAGKIYVNIDGFGADIKLYCDDLGTHFKCRYRTTELQALPEAKGGTVLKTTEAPSLTIGDRLSLLTHRFDSGNRRYVLLPV